MGFHKQTKHSKPGDGGMREWVQGYGGGGGGQDRRGLETGGSGSMGSSHIVLLMIDLQVQQQAERLSSNKARCLSRLISASQKALEAVAHTSMQSKGTQVELKPLCPCTEGADCTSVLSNKQQHGRPKSLTASMEHAAGRGCI